MNQADKEEAFALIARILHLTRPTPELDALRALITRQKPDEDGERWRFCLEHGSPVCTVYDTVDGPIICWLQSLPRATGPQAPYTKSEITPNEAVDAARAAMKGTS